MKIITDTLRFILVFLALCIGLLLVSCAELPLTMAIDGQHGSYAYSAKRGVEIHVRASK